MEEPLRIMKKVGRVLLIVGLVDAAAMIYCILNRIPYASGFNILALIAALFLFRGSLKATRVIALFAGLYIAVFSGAFVIVPVVLPWGFIRVLFHLHPIMGLFLLPVLLGTIGLSAWVYRSLTSPSVRAAMEEAGVNLRRPWRRPAAGIVFGAAIILLLAVVLPLALNGKTGQEAKARAAAQVGPGYRFFVSDIEESYSSSGKEVHATVTAYNDRVIREVQLEWKE